MLEAQRRGARGDELGEGVSAGGDEGRGALRRRDGASQELRLLVPALLCGSIIGKGGTTIRQFAEDSKAAIGLSPQVHPPSPLSTPQ